MIQIVLLDSKGYIIKHQDFNEKDVDEILNYLEDAFEDSEVNKIECKKWPGRNVSVGK